MPVFFCLTLSLATALVSVGCTSTQELEQIDTRLSDLQIQILQLQKQNPTKAELRDLQTTLQDGFEGQTEADANLRLDLAELTRQFERLQAKIEDTNFRLAQLSQQITATNEELQAVRSVAEEARSSRSASQPRMVVGEDDPQTLYDTAYGDYTAGNYDLAILSFRKYLEDHPGTDQADNAAYWLGECYYNRGQFQQAIRYFDSVLEDYESSDRDVSARLKKAYSHLELGQRDEGAVHLRGVACDYEGTDGAKLARKRLEELGFDVDCPGAL